MSQLTYNYDLRWLIADRKAAILMWKQRLRNTTNSKKRERYERRIEQLRVELAELVLSQ